MTISTKLPLKSSTQCIFLLLFLLFSQIKWGDRFNPPPIKTKDKGHIIHKSINKSTQKKERKIERKRELEGFRVKERATIQRKRDLVKYYKFCYKD